MSYIETSALSLEYRSGGERIEALHEVDLTIDRGEFVSVVGPSGCGKSTLMHIIAGFLKPSSGEVSIDGKNINRPGRDRAIVLQKPTLLPWLSLRANVELGPRARKMKSAERKAIGDKYLSLVGLEEFAGRRPYELSGGMQQRGAVARALANESDVLLMDEPFGALDALTREDMQVELLRIWQATKRTVIFITHDVEEACLLGTRVVAMTPRPGKIMAMKALSFGSRQGANVDVDSVRQLKAGQEFSETIMEVLAYISAGRTPKTLPKSTAQRPC